MEIPTPGSIETDIAGPILSDYQQKSLDLIKQCAGNRWFETNGWIRRQTIEALEKMGLIEVQRKFMTVERGYGLFGRQGIQRVPYCEIKARLTPAGKKLAE